MKGESFFNLKDIKQATLCYKKCLTLDSNHIQASIQLGLILIKQQQPDRALKYLRHALKLDPLKTEAVIAQAQAIAQQDKAKAIESLSETEDYKVITYKA